MMFLRFWARQTEFFVISGYFSPQTTRKIKILKIKKKTPGGIIISNMSKINKNHWCMIHGIWSTTDRIFSHSGPFFALLHPLTQPPPAPFPPPANLTTQRTKILKKWKKQLEISSFYTGVSKIMIRWCTVPEIWCADGRTNGLEKWHIEVGAPPKKIWCTQQGHVLKNHILISWN